jgi:hypothetical protein
VKRVRIHSRAGTPGDADVRPASDGAALAGSLRPTESPDRDVPPA